MQFFTTEFVPNNFVILILSAKGLHQENVSLGFPFMISGEIFILNLKISIGNICRFL